MPKEQTYRIHGYPEAKGCEDQWLRESLARHAQPQSTHEQQLTGDRWVRIEEHRTADGGSIGIRVDITDPKCREASFRLLFEENPLPMWVVDVNTLELLSVNAAPGQIPPVKQYRVAERLSLPPSRWCGIKSKNISKRPEQSIQAK
jgi:hypothetical protein